MFYFHGGVSAVVRKVSLFVIPAVGRYLELCPRFVPGVVNPNPAAYFAPAVLAGGRRWMVFVPHFGLTE